jgi:hypothetical protein
MTTTFYITLGLKNGHQMNLTNEGFQTLMNDCVSFDTEAAVRAAIENIDAQALVNDGFKEYHEVKLWLTAQTVEADGEISSKIITEKAITVDTTEVA